jgi:hypothetical protein
MCIIAHNFSNIVILVKDSVGWNENTTTLFSLCRCSCVEANQEHNGSDALTAATCTFGHVRHLSCRCTLVVTSIFSEMVYHFKKKIILFCINYV